LFEGNADPVVADIADATS